MIKYQFAKDESDYTVDINDLTKESVNGKKYLCIECQNELIPHIGQKKVKHFHHKPQDEVITCAAGETYLHSASISILSESIRQRINTGNPLFIKVEQNVFCGKCHFPEFNKHRCLLDTQIIDLNILEDFTNVCVEKKEGNFRPDILLYNNSGNKLHIEITVHHGVDENKSLSGNRIIEIFIENEEQIRALKNDYFTKENIKFRLHNYPIEPAFIFLKPEECQKGNLRRFIVYKSGKSILKSFTYYEHTKIKNYIMYEKDYNSHKYDSLFDSDNNLGKSQQYIDDIEEAFIKNITIKNCHLCLSHTYNIKNDYLSHTIICKFTDSIIENSNLICEKYSPDKNSIYSIQLNTFNKEKEVRIVKANEEEKRKQIEFRKLKAKLKIEKQKEEERRKAAYQQSIVVKFVVFNDGTSVFIAESPKSKLYSTENVNICYSVHTDISSKQFDEKMRSSWRFSPEYIDEINKAYKNGISVISCHLCTYCDLITTDSGFRFIRCSKTGKDIREPNYAKECKFINKL